MLMMTTATWLSTPSVRKIISLVIKSTIIGGCVSDQIDLADHGWSLLWLLDNE
jgi:hypothetical protein